MTERQSEEVVRQWLESKPFSRAREAEALEEIHEAVIALAAGIKARSKRDFAVVTEVGPIRHGIMDYSLTFAPKLNSPYLITLAVCTDIRPEHLLDNKNRKLVLNAIYSKPGIGLRALSRRLDLNVTTVVHHARALQAANLVYLHRWQCAIGYFPGSTRDGNHAGTIALRSGSTRRVMDAVMEKPGDTVSGISKRVRLARSTVEHHLARLVRVGLVRLTQTRARQAWPTQKKAPQQVSSEDEESHASAKA